MEKHEYLKMEDVEDQMWWFRAQRKNLSRLLVKYNPNKVGLILDVGCGTGGFLKYLSAKYEDCMLYGIDINSYAINAARKKSDIPIVRGSVLSLPFEDASFSSVLSADVLDNQSVDPLLASQEIYRCLILGGFFIVSVPAFQWLWSAHDRRVQTERRYSRKELSILLRCAGFTVTYATYCNTILFPIMVFRRRIVGLFYDKSDIMHFPPVVDALFGFILAVEHKLLSWGIRFPYGGTVLAVAHKDT